MASPKNSPPRFPLSNHPAPSPTLRPHSGPHCTPHLQPCVFRVDYTIDAAAGREFGTVFVNERDNVAAALVGAGWARVRAPGGSQSPFYDELAKAQESAEAAALGLHTKDKSAAAASVRDTLSADGEELLQLVHACLTEEQALGSRSDPTTIQRAAASGKLLPVSCQCCIAAVAIFPCRV